MPAISFNDELLKKKYQILNDMRISGGKDNNGKSGGVKSDELSFYDRYGANDVFSAAAKAGTTNPTVRTGMDAGASSQGASLVGDGNNNFSLVNALQTDNLPDSNVAIGGVNAQAGVHLATPSGLNQTTGSGENGAQGGATDGQTNQHRGAYQNFLAQAGGGGGILESSPGPTGNRFLAGDTGGNPIGDKPPASQPKPTGEATLTTTNPNESGKSEGGDKVGDNNSGVNPNNPSDSGNPKVGDNPDVQNNPDNPKNDTSTDNPPETTKQIDKEAEKQARLEAEKRAQEEAQKRAAEQDKDKIAA